MIITTRPITFDRQTYIRLHLRRLLSPQQVSLIGLTVVAWIVILLSGVNWYWVCGLALLSSISIVPTLLSLALLWSGLAASTTFFEQAWTYRIDTEAGTITAESNDEAWTVAVSELHRIQKTDEYYLIFQSPDSFTYFPQNAFETEADRVAFERFL